MTNNQPQDGKQLDDNTKDSPSFPTRRSIFAMSACSALSLLGISFFNRDDREAIVKDNEFANLIKDLRLKISTRCLDLPWVDFDQLGPQNYFKGLGLGEFCIERATHAASSCGDDFGTVNWVKIKRIKDHAFDATLSALSDRTVPNFKDLLGVKTHLAERHSLILVSKDNVSIEFLSNPEFGKNPSTMFDEPDYLVRVACGERSAVLNANHLYIVNASSDRLNLAVQFAQGATRMAAGCGPKLYIQNNRLTVDLSNLVCLTHKDFSAPIAPAADIAIPMCVQSGPILPRELCLVFDPQAVLKCPIDEFKLLIRRSVVHDERFNMATGKLTSFIPVRINLNDECVTRIPVNTSIQRINSACEQVVNAALRFSK